MPLFSRLGCASAWTALGFTATCAPGPGTGVSSYRNRHTNSATRRMELHTQARRTLTTPPRPDLFTSGSLSVRPFGVWCPRVWETGRFRADRQAGSP